MVDTGIDGYAALGADTNKRKTDGSQETKQGIVAEKLPELDLSMSDKEIIRLTSKWESKWRDSPVRTEWERQGEMNEKYWLGKHTDQIKADKSVANVDNLIFESLETYLPQVTRRNPEPLVTLDNSELDELGHADEVKMKYVSKVKGRLADLADKNKLRLKLKKSTRHWAIFLLGIAKFGWDLDKDIPIVRIIRPKKIILDPEATIDEDGYTGKYIGEIRKLEASTILALIGDGTGTVGAKKAITDLVSDDTATDIQFTEWWTPQYMCWRMNKTILLKKKNPHWNYGGTAASTVDTYGNETPGQEQQDGINHFATPKMPYEFLSVFNLGDQPVDKTSLIGQNIANQDKINKRNKQLDKNADSMNGGIVVSLGRSGLGAIEAKGVTESLQKGGTIIIPDGSPREAIDRYPAPSLPPDIYNQLVDTRTRMRDIFGTRGSTPAGIASEDTVRGKILNRGLDTDRIGGGVSEYLEQHADDIYNWFVQLLYVYDTGFQFVNGAIPPKVVISVKEGSLLPKDSLTLANQAIDLATAGKMSVLDMYKRLEFPNPEEMAANVWLEVNAPHVLYKEDPRVQEAIQMQQQAAAAQAQTDAQQKATESAQAHEQAMALEASKQQGKSLLAQVPIK